jgi:hypothetical protein
MQHHKYSLTELENMIPWEREVYVTLLSNHIKEENEKKKKGRTKVMEPVPVKENKKTSKTSI